MADRVARMLSRERTDRPPDLCELLEVLRRYADVQAPSFGSAAAPPPSLEQVPARPVRWIAAVVAIGALLRGRRGPVAPAGALGCAPRREPGSSTAPRVVRGGSIFGEVFDLRAWSRTQAKPNEWRNTIGFRCARKGA
ncbi:MAG: hypothetical protein EXR72_26510 [Myxococcales bacterium]|nr:hypothetical protein [Myxococcales bacterium]